MNTDILIQRNATLLEFIEKNESTIEKKERLERIREVYSRSLNNAEELKDYSDLSISEKEVISELEFGEKTLERIQEIETNALKEEGDILEELFNVMGKRTKVRAEDARYDLIASIKDVLHGYLLSLVNSKFEEVYELLQDIENCNDYKDLTLEGIARLAQSEEAAGLPSGFGELTPLSAERHCWQSFNELIILPLGSVYEDPKSFHQFMKIELNRARNTREKLTAGNNLTHALQRLRKWLFPSPNG